MKAYLAINEDYYEVGATYKVPAPPDKKFFHLYFSLDKCPITPGTHIYLIDAWGEDLEQLEDGSFATNLVTIEKEIRGEPPAAALSNSGCLEPDAPNTGKFNQGGNNTGDSNQGNHNTGNRNQGNYNTGTGNTGSHNTGDYNEEDYNTGSYNKGSYNTGHYNEGRYNTGHSNTGWYNSGNNNKGQSNCGDSNEGDFNTGDCNIGNYNVGHFNMGHYNVGSWNIADYQTGCFNTIKENEGVRLFNKRTKMKMGEWVDTPAYNILMKMPGEDNQTWWDNLEIIQKARIKAIPNFNPTIFKECTGIDVR